MLVQRSDSMSSDSESTDWEQIGKALGKAGIVTEKSLGEAMEKGIGAALAKLDKNVSPEAQDFMKHIKGECGNNDCPIGKEVMTIYEGAYKKGLSHGIPLGQFAAKKGLKF